MTFFPARPQAASPKRHASVEIGEITRGDFADQQHQDDADDRAEIGQAEAEGHPVHPAQQLAGGVAAVVPEGRTAQIDVGADEMDPQDDHQEILPCQEGGQPDQQRLLEGDRKGPHRMPSQSGQQRSHSQPDQPHEQTGQEEPDHGRPVVQPAQVAAHQEVGGVAFQPIVHHREEEQPGIELHQEQAEAGEGEPEDAVKPIAAERDGDGSQGHGRRPRGVPPQIPIDEGAGQEQSHQPA